MTTAAIPPDATIVFPAGLPGFEACRRFVLMQSAEFDPGVCLKGLDANGPAFFCMDPRRLDDRFACDLSAADRARLGAAPGDACVWLVIVSFAGDAPRVHWRAPVVINPAAMRGIQVVPAEPETAAAESALVGGAC